MKAAAVVAGVFAVAALLALANRVPVDYRPLQLTPGQKTQAAKHFVSLIQNFGNACQQSEPFSWSISQDELNAALAAADEIAAIRPGARRGTLDRAMQEAQLAGPAVALKRRRAVFMIQSRGKIVSAGVGISSPAPEALAVSVDGVRLGCLPLPTMVMRANLQRLSETFSHGQGPSADKTLSPLAQAEAAHSALTAVIGAIGSGYLSTDFVWPINKKHVRIERVEITEGRLTLHVVPLND